MSSDFLSTKIFSSVADFISVSSVEILLLIAESIMLLSSDFLAAKTFSSVADSISVFSLEILLIPSFPNSLIPSFPILTATFLSLERILTAAPKDLPPPLPSVTAPLTDVIKSSPVASRLRLLVALSLADLFIASIESVGDLI